MSWARSRVLCGLLLAAAFAAVPASSGAAEPRPVVDLDRIALRGDHFVAPLASGNEAKLTLAPELQQVASKVLDSANAVRGGMVVIDARTGKVLVWAERARDGRHHQVLSTSRVPAASVFKLVTTAALFETTSISPKDPVCISGGMHGIERRHLDAPHGDATECAPFHYAIGFSKNAVFAQLATHRLLRSGLVDTAAALGFNGLVPFELDVPVGTLEVPYGDLEFARAAAGFLGSTLSPLGGAFLASVIAHGGEATKFHILEPALNDVDSDANGAGETSDDKAEVVSRVLKVRTAERMRRMMEVTVRSGTCRHAFTDESGHRYLGSISVAGKTGTLRPEANEGMTSWFIGFAPADKPEIIISVMLENGAVWRRKSNELARDFMRSYFHAHGHLSISDPFAPADAARVASAKTR